MTETTESATTQIQATTAERRKARFRVRVRFPLVLKIFLLTVILIAIVVGISFGVTIRRADRVASETVRSAIGRAGDLFNDLEARRLRILQLGVMTLASDPPFHAYIEDALHPGATALESETGEPAAQTPVAESTPPPSEGAPTPPPAAIDTASILSMLQQRRELLGTDLLVFMDDQGVVVARTDQADLTRTQGEDLYESQPLVADIIENPRPVDERTGSSEPVIGTMLLGGVLYHIAMSPLSVGGKPPIGYLINAYAIDEVFANQIAQTTSAGVAFLPANQSMTAPRSTNAPSAASLRSMPDVASLLAKGSPIAPLSVVIDQSRYVMTGQPLKSTGEPVGGAIFVRSLDAELAPFREIEKTLMVAAIVVLPIAFLLSWLIGKRLSRPIEDLAGMAQAVSEGDYSVQPDTTRADEVGVLARSFSSMLSSLRDKDELEQLYSEMAQKLRDRESGTAPMPASRPPASREGTILVTDLRGVVGVEGSEGPAEVIQRITSAMRLQEAEVLRQEGRVFEMVGHRLISVFEGERSIIHAVRAARAIHEELERSHLTAGAGIATGEFITGSVELSADRGQALLGNAPLLALLLAWEAPSGCVFVSLETAQAAGGDILSAGTREEVTLRWLPAPLAVVSLPLGSLTQTMMKTFGGPAMSMAQTLALDSSTAPAMPTSELSPGALFANRYDIESVIGRGGMGVVYRAMDRQLDETVAIKTLTGSMLTGSTEQLERFKREIRLARRITHRNVLRTFDYGESNGTYFISMEYVRGYTLAELLEENRRMHPRTSLGIARQMCRGLQAAHEQGIIHRDIKPQNVLIDHRGEAKLMDFGIARMAEAPDSMTQAGIIVGTPHYMSPEQVQAKPLDSRTDVYSVGVVLYEMLAGRRPFESSSVTGVLMAHITEAPEPPILHRPEISPEVNAIVLRCLAKDPQHRYADAGALLAELDRLQGAAAA